MNDRGFHLYGTNIAIIIFPRHLFRGFSLSYLNINALNKILKFNNKYYALIKQSIKLHHKEMMANSGNPLS